jgi:hypothetical protein
LRRILCGAAALGVAAALPLASSTAAPTTAKATRLVTITFRDTGGKGRWSTVGDTDAGTMAMNYSWSGTGRIRVPTTALKNPGKAKFNVTGTATLVGSWVGDLVGKQFNTSYPGPYHCSYKGSNVKLKIQFGLSNSPAKKGRIRLTLTSLPSGTGYSFFPREGNGATTECANPVGRDSAPAFDPTTLFRYAYTDNAMVTTQGAVIDVPPSLLPKGSVRVVWPRETGDVNSPLRPKITWSNKATLVLRAR